MTHLHTDVDKTILDLISIDFDYSRIGDEIDKIQPDKIIGGTENVNSETMMKLRLRWAKDVVKFLRKGLSVAQSDTDPNLVIDMIRKDKSYENDPGRDELNVESTVAEWKNYNEMMSASIATEICQTTMNALTLRKNRTCPDPLNAAIRAQVDIAYAENVKNRLLRVGKQVKETIDKHTTYTALLNEEIEKLKRQSPMSETDKMQLQRLEIELEDAQKTIKQLTEKLEDAEVKLNAMHDERKVVVNANVEGFQRMMEWMKDYVENWKPM